LRIGGVLAAVFNVGGVVVDLPEDALAFMLESAEVVLPVRVVVLGV
jgi:hypothetical protein